MYHFFGWEPPEFAHLPLLVNEQKHKLSKREGHASVDFYIEKGYFPEALVNFVAMLGWAPNSTQEIFTMEELIQNVRNCLN